MAAIRVIDVVAAAAEHFNVSIELILSARRYAGIVLPRQVAAYVARELTGQSWPQIGRVMRRDHSTLILAHRKIGRLAATDYDMARHINQIKESLVDD